MRTIEDEEDDDLRSSVILFFFIIFVFAVFAVFTVTANAAPAMPQRSVTATVYRMAPIPLYFVIFFLNNTALFMPQFAPIHGVTARQYRLAATAPSYHRGTA